MKPKKALPKLFHRRLALLLAVMLTSSFGLSAQLVRLTLIEGAERRAVAQSRLDRRSYLPTWRGVISDRNGNELAVDVASYDVAVEYDVIGGAWVIEQAFRAARKRLGERWHEMGPEERAAALLRERVPFDQQVADLWHTICRLGELDRAELDSRLMSIRRQVEQMATAHWDARRAEEYAKFGKPRPGEEDPFEVLPIREQEIPHVILPRVSDDVAFEFKRLADTLPGLRVLDSWRREYPWHTVQVRLDRSTLPREIASSEEIEIEVVGVADHILGSIRNQVYYEDVQRKPFRSGPSEEDIDLQGYRPGDRVGARGLEQVFEDHLRGHRGVVMKHLNTGVEERIPPQPGRNLQLTLDIHLQARIQAIMSPQFGLVRVRQFHVGWESDGAPRPTPLPLGTPLKGAAVVLDVDSGEILAMVTTPTMATGAEWSEARRTMEHPFVNRAIETPYPPGSIIKPLILAAAIAEGVHRLEDRIACTGHFYPDWKDRARCWIYREAYGYTTHTDRSGGPLGAEEALARSCNIYFYTLADRLGIERLHVWFDRFGMGRELDIGLIQETTAEDGSQIRYGEFAGSFPSAEAIDDLRKRGALDFETISEGIGQGAVTWTPLHAANAYAMLARNGHLRDAILVRNDPRPRARARDDRLEIDPRVVTAALEGLRQSIEDPIGTGYGIRHADDSMNPIINVSGVTVWGKTGTAEAPALPVDDDDDGQANRYIRDLDHAWFVGLVGGGPPPRRPQFAIAVLLEYAGSGGRAAGPLANQIIHALRAEGYLPENEDS